MKTGHHWPAISLAALIVLSGLPSPLQAAEAQPKDLTRALEPVAFVGTVIAVVPTSRTLVVDVPLDTDALRIGAEVTSATTITADGQAVSLDRLQAGDRVRISIRRVTTGNEAISVEILSDARG
jgi:hypothetical protein